MVTALFRHCGREAASRVVTSDKGCMMRRPDRELFVVFNEQRDTLAAGFPALANRAVVVKVNHLIRF